MKTITIKPQWGGPCSPLRHTWEGMVNVDQFRWMVRADMQEQLAMAHAEIGARHVRAVGMLDDEMRVLTKDPGVWPEQRLHERPNWQINTMIIERLLERGIFPMITTAFMPGVLASGTRTVFETRSRISLPTDMKEWRKLVGHLVRHLVDHFGIGVVRGLYFEVWNEPNLRNGFFEGDQRDFFDLYENTQAAIKEVDASFKVGGPSTARAEWMPEFMSFCRSRNIEPEYIIGHVYNNDSDSQPLSPFDGPQEDRVSQSPHFAAGVIRGTRKFLDEIGYRGEVHWNEWGRSWFPCEPVRESANEAAFIVKTMAEVSQLGDYFAYWCLSDIYDQVGYGSRAFHGNYGMLNLQGLRKPAYHAFQLLCRLGERRVAVEGEHLDSLHQALATESKEGGAVLFYAYDASGSHPPCAESLKLRVRLPEGSAVQSVTRLTEDENNILHTWRASGSPPYLKRELLEELRAANRLKPFHGYDQIGSEMSFEFSAPGVALIEFQS
ncbi:MAG: hypothetical protein SFU85_12575 [Candidatus Methylacidiphilales bacterium]|nr:hypothetical protein [Candidatus Methylacidiphilales bacterium]